MHISKRIVTSLVIFVLTCSLFIGCSKIDIKLNQSSTLKPIGTPVATTSNTISEKSVDNSADNGTKDISSPLESWVGDYTFSEYAPKDQNMFYTVTIYKEFNGFYAKISIDGFQTIVRLQAIVTGDENSVKLIFDKYLPDNQFEPYNKGDVLISFEKRNSTLNTTWGKILPMLESNNTPGKVYFKAEQ